MYDISIKEVNANVLEMANWCFNHIGDFREEWTTHSLNGNPVFRFKNIEDATAFKLKWV